MAALHTMKLRFSLDPTDQLLYESLKASSEREIRTPLSRQMKYLLAMALGLRAPDNAMWARLDKALAAQEPSSTSTSPQKRDSGNRPRLYLVPPNSGCLLNPSGNAAQKGAEIKDVAE